MISLQTKRKRFSLLLLQEDEMYVQEFSASIELDEALPVGNGAGMKQEKGKLHICSRSLIFEPDNPKLNIYKFMFRDMKAMPTLFIYLDVKEALPDSSIQKLMDNKPKAEQSTANKFQCSLSKIVEIVVQGPPSPYRQIEFPKGVLRNVVVEPLFKRAKDVLDLIEKLWTAFQTPADKDEDPAETVQKIVLGSLTNCRFNTAYLESLSEKPLLTKPNPIYVRRIMPMVSIYGILYLTNANIYFQAMYTSVTKPVKKIPLNNIIKIYRRRFELKQIGIEIWAQKKKGKEKAYFYAFGSYEEREEIYLCLMKKIPAEAVSEASLEKELLKWQAREISNYEYIKLLNFAAYRSFADLTQYPVYPWIIQDYVSTSLDLNNKEIYRDLTKPIGALNSKRLVDCRERYNDMQNPKFLYGTHYSTPGYVIGYLLRKHPEYMLKLQSGRFDKPDRLFWGIKKDWNNCLNNPAIVKELIPEFFGEDESFLLNHLKLDLGVRQKGKRVDEVKLPKWAKSATDFLRINREALESEYVSAHLHHWIDLIFGYKQRGPAAVEADNVFHYLTYEGIIDLDSIKDPIEKRALRVQINEFGQTPKQLFKMPHPPRNVANGIPPQLTSGNHHEETKENSSHNHGGGSLEIRETIWDEENASKVVMTSIPKIHKNIISSLHFMKNEPSKVITTSFDGCVKVVDLETRSVKKSFKVCDLAISASHVIKEDEIYALGGYDNNVYFFHLNYGSAIDTISGAHDDSIASLFYSSSKSILATGSWDCTVKLWKLKDGALNTSVDPVSIYHDSHISSLTITPDGNLLVYGDIEGGVNGYDIRSQSGVFSYKVPGEKVNAVLSSNNYAIVILSDSKICLLDPKGLEIGKIPTEVYNGRLVSGQVEGNRLLTCTDKGHVGIYDLLQEKKLFSLGVDYGREPDTDLIVKPENEFTCVNIHREGKMALFGTKTGIINMMNIQE